MTTWLHLRCLHAPELGRWCQQSMCGYRWPLDGWLPWRSYILLGPALFPAGGDVRKQRGLHWPGFTRGTGRVLCAVIAVPASDRPLLALTSVLGAEIYRILCWQESLSLLLSQVIVGNPNFQWNTIVPPVQDEGKCAFAASCIYSIILIRHLGRLKADEQRQGERNGNVAWHKREKRDLKSGCWRCLCPKATWWFKHWGLKR